MPTSTHTELGINQREAEARLSKLAAPVGPREKPQPIFGLMKGHWPAVPLSAFEPVPEDDAATWGL
jgi:hypothetical protein